VLRITLETIYRAKGFKRVILCIREARSNSMLGRFGFGPDALEIARSFRFSLVFTPDIFHAALAKGVDILISDTNDPKIAARIPGWFRKAVAAETFVVFPLCVNGNAVAMIYADRAHAGEIVISEKGTVLAENLAQSWLCWPSSSRSEVIGRAVPIRQSLPGDVFPWDGRAAYQSFHHGS
jgi:hypothetical protein